jgi:predicted RecB family nuclease
MPAGTLSSSATTHAIFQHESIGAWAACDRCAVLIGAGHWSQLTDRAVYRFMKKYGVPKDDWREVREQLAEIHQLFKERMIKEV